MSRWKIALLLVGVVLISAVFAGCSSEVSKSDPVAAQPPTDAPGGSPSNRTGTAVGDTASDNLITGPTFVQNI